MHPAVVQALQKEGWAITQEQVHFLIGKRNFWIDLRAERTESSGKKNIILIEVKGFDDDNVNQLRNAIG